jgi:hypothetical protein
MRRTLAALTTLALTIVAAPAVAQDPGDHTPADHGAMATAEGLPDGWLMRFDRSSAGPDMVDFQVMEPGWHMTTGRAGSGIFWQPGMTATGDYTVETTMHLFDPASHAEAFGIFIGGERLGEADQSYLYFLVRQTGEYLIKRRRGADTEDVQGWTAHEAIPEAPTGERGPTQYDLAVRVGAETVEMEVNGQTVHSMPRDGLSTDGLAGIRVNHMLDIHVETLALDPG